MTNNSENELQEDSNLSQESSSEDEVVLQSQQYIQPNNKSNASNATNVYGIHRMAKNGLDCECLYHRFLKWKIRYENILDCELAMLSEIRKCKEVIGLVREL